MKYNYRKQIDVLDMLIDWISHWKSFCTFIFIGFVAVAIYFIVSENKINNTEKVEMDAATLASTNTLSTLSSAQIDALTIEELEKNFLTEGEVADVEELSMLYKEYVANLEIYNSQKDSMEFVDRTDAFGNIAQAKNIIDTRKTLLTADQRVLYNELVSRDEESEKVDKTSLSTMITSTNQSSFSKSKAILVILLFIIIHFVITATRYIFDDKLKHSDNLEIVTGVPEYTRMINWDVINSKRGINKFVNKLRFSSIKKVPYEDTVLINASSIADKLKTKKYSSVAVVGGIEEEVSTLANRIKLRDNSLVVKSIDSITLSVNGSDDIVGVDSAVVAAHMGKTRYNNIFDEMQALKDRGVDIIGVAIFE